MGYWGTHPMAGDSPLDAQAVLKRLLFSERERDVPEGPYWNRYEFARRLQASLLKVVDAWEKLVERNKESWEHPNTHEGFVLPFTMADLGVRTDDPALSERIKAMIKDGGAVDRGYPPGDWGGPEGYARELINNWDAFMAGEEHGVPPDIGLIATINARAGSVDGGDGLVNTD